MLNKHQEELISKIKHHFDGKQMSWVSSVIYKAPREIRDDLIFRYVDIFEREYNKEKLGHKKLTKALFAANSYLRVMCEGE